MVNQSQVQIAYFDSAIEQQINHIYDLFGQQEFKTATENILKLIISNPEEDRAYYLMGLFYKHHECWADAQSWFKQAISKNTNQVEYWGEYAAALHNYGNVNLAIDAYKRVVALNRQKITLPIFCIGELYQKTDQHEKALPYYKKAIEMEPDDYRGHLGVAMVLHFLRKTEQAEPYYLAALEKVKATKNPNEVKKVAWEYAMQALLKGDFKKGWACYDARLAQLERFYMTRFDYPVWAGQDLKNKTILVQAEQGYGDVVMFASILPEIIKQAQKVVLAVQPSLVELFTRSFPEISVESLNPWESLEHDKFIPDWLSKYPNIDYQSAIGSLPRWQRKDLKSFPKLGSYLTTDETKAKQFKQLLDKATSKADKKVGLVWQGNTNNGKIGQRKSIPAELLNAFVGIPKTSFVSLQLEEIEQQLDVVPTLKVTRMGQHFTNLDQTAALISQLDLVVCVDTVTAHLAAALGKPVIVMLWFAADWRYLEQAETCYWYPNMQIVRQSKAGDWKPVLQTVQKKIREFKV